MVFYRVYITEDNNYNSYSEYNRSNIKDQNDYYDISRNEERKRRQQLCCVDSRTITNMEKQGASQADIDFAKQTQYSTNPINVTIHRDYINTYNRDDPWLESNNFVMHPKNYCFDVKGKPNTSPQYIGGMFLTLQNQCILMVLKLYFRVMPLYILILTFSIDNHLINNSW